MSLFVHRFGVVSGVLAVALSFALGATVSYVTSYQPLLRVERERRTFLIDIVLQRLLTVYREEISDCDLRANVMAADGPRYLRCLSRLSGLSITYATRGYSSWELNLTYEAGQGTAGRAFQTREPIVYDSRTRRDPERTMTVEQLVATDQVTSAVSVPIYRSGNVRREPLGVLNLDSVENVENTKFNGEATRTLLMKYADVIGTVLE